MASVRMINLARSQVPKLLAARCGKPRPDRFDGRIVVDMAGSRFGKFVVPDCRRRNLSPGADVSTQYAEALHKRKDQHFCAAKGILTEKLGQRDAASQRRAQLLWGKACATAGRACGEPISSQGPAAVGAPAEFVPSIPASPLTSRAHSH